MYTSKISFSSNKIYKNQFYDKRNITFSGSLLNNIPKTTKEKINNKEDKDTKAKFIKIGGIGVLFAGAATTITKLFKHSSSPNAAIKNIKKLIKTLKP